MHKLKSSETFENLKGLNPFWEVGPIVPPSLVLYLSLELGSIYPEIRCFFLELILLQQKDNR